MGSKRLPQPDTPANETSEFRNIELKNKLRVLLISSTPNAQNDPDWVVKYPRNGLSKDAFFGNEPFSSFPSYLPHSLTHDLISCSSENSTSKVGQCTLSFSIKAGALSDPEDFQGLAHFVEHIVHHGSKKYPGENQLENFIANLNGGRNAFTDRMLTNYHCVFTSSKENIEEVCKMYAAMLSDPIISIDAVAREVESVDNEYFMRKVQDYFRLNHLIQETCILERVNNPLRQFFIGSKEKLMPERPHSAKRLRDASLRFVQTHYFGENISAAIKAPLDLDTLEKIAIETLSCIPQKSKFPNEAKCRGKECIPYDPQLYNRLYTVKPLSHDGHRLYITWAFDPKVWKDYKSKTFNYIEYILSYGGPGGLEYYLREKKFIYGFYCLSGLNGAIRNDYCTNLCIMAKLTLDGRENVDEVIHAIFSFINLHRNAGPQEGIFKQMLAYEDSIYENFCLGTSPNSVMEYCSQILYYDSQDVLLGTQSLHDDCDNRQIKECLDRMTPERANFTIMTHLHGPEDNFRTCDIYGTRYRIQYLTKDMINNLTNIEPYKEFILIPPPNPYIAKTSFLAVKDVAIESETIQIGDRGKMSFKPTRNMTSQQLRFAINIFPSLPPNAVKIFKPAFEVWCMMLRMECFKKLYDQSDLGLKWSIGAGDLGMIQLYAKGLRAGFFDAINSLIDTIENYQISKCDFEIAFDFVLDAYHNCSADHMNIAYDMLLQLMRSEYVTNIEYHEHLKSLSFEDFSKIVQIFKKKNYVVAELIGYATRNEAIILAERLQKLKSEPISSIELDALLSQAEPRTLVPKGERCLRLKSIMPKEKMFVVFNHYEMAPKDDETEYVTRLIAAMLGKVFFHELRTMEQLGYSLGVVVSTDACRTGIILYVLAHRNKHSPCFINSRLDSFLQQFYEKHLTPESITQLINRDQKITRDAEYIRLYYSKYLVKDHPESEVKKLSIQVLGDLEFEDCHCLCEKKNHGDGKIKCIKSKWTDTIAVIGKRKAEVAFGAHESSGTNNNNGDKNEYFITSIEEYHKSNM